jgi:GNAT superfamily N-acetyltransferase
VLIKPLTVDLVPDLERLMALGEPFVRVRTTSDYWLYASLFSSSCPVALEGQQVAGAIIAFRSKDDPRDVYIQDVMIHPERRRKGIGRSLMEAVRAQAESWGCSRAYLTSEPENLAAHATWTSLGFINCLGDYEISGVQVVAGFKGPGKDRAVYELFIDQ